MDRLSCLRVLRPCWRCLIKLIVCVGGGLGFGITWHVNTIMSCWMFISNWAENGRTWDINNDYLGTTKAIAVA